MSPGRFRLEPVLRIRRLEERAAAAVAARAAADAAAAEHDAEQQARHLAAAPVPGSGTVTAFLATVLRNQAQAVDAATARAHAQGCRSRADGETVAWVTAAQRAKGLERLREQHQRAVQDAVGRVEARTVDDLVTRRYADRVQQGEVR